METGLGLLEQKMYICVQSSPCAQLCFQLSSFPDCQGCWACRQRIRKDLFNSFSVVRLVCHISQQGSWGLPCHQQKQTTDWYCVGVHSLQVFTLSRHSLSSGVYSLQAFILFKYSLSSDIHSPPMFTLLWCSLSSAVLEVFPLWVFHALILESQRVVLPLASWRTLLVRQCNMVPNSFIETISCTLFGLGLHVQNFIATISIDPQDDSLRS